MASGDWMKSNSFLANAGHMLAGGIWLVITVLFAHTWLPILISEGVLLVAILFKEYWIDLRYESNETVWTSTIDVLGWAAGNTIVWGLVLLARVLGTWAVH